MFHNLIMDNLVTRVTAYGCICRYQSATYNY